ncbi:hypothetical protein GCM10007092_08930 [Thermus composti]|uniref:Uncharacterized protein n=1 Tax=Thermus composti TaxID=532059 RepID=A0ABV6PXT7_9DEIN|nr:hypothetical protein [Thermus composti]GGM97466.1 hypothetical protein GCM10007092_08930 [Thermus composti]
MRLGLCLFLLLGLAWAAPPPLFGPSLPEGTEIRLLSPDLRTLHGAWRVERGRLVPLSQPLPPRPGQEVRLLLVLPGGGPQAFQGIADRGDVWLLQGRERWSLRELLLLYRLVLPERFWP